MEPASSFRIGSAAGALLTGAPRMQPNPVLILLALVSCVGRYLPCTYLLMRKVNLG